VLTCKTFRYYSRYILVYSLANLLQSYRQRLERLAKLYSRGVQDFSKIGTTLIIRSREESVHGPRQSGNCEGSSLQVNTVQALRLRFEAGKAFATPFALKFTLSASKNDWETSQAARQRRRTSAEA